jgi:hypothetical protein
MDGAMPVDARKKPKSTATMAGPALIDPPLISTTRMIANSSTTDSEMATTDHTLRSVHSPGPEMQPRTPPPEPSCHQRAPRMRQVTHRWPTAGPGANRGSVGAERRRTPPPSPNTSARHLRSVIRRAPEQGIHRDRCHVHTLCSQAIRIVATDTPRGSHAGGPSHTERGISTESPAGVMSTFVGTKPDRTPLMGKRIDTRKDLRKSRHTSPNPG